MARGSRSNTSTASRGSPLRSLTDLLSMPIPSGHVNVPGFGGPSFLGAVEDGRVWHPDPDHGPLTIGGRWARVVVHKRPIVARSKALAPLTGPFGFRGMPVGLQVPVGVQFHSPFKVVTCVRRKVRRSVLFAKRKAGYGKRQKMPSRTWRSEIWC